MKIQNAKILPKVYFGLHMAPGVAEYKEPGAEPYRILVEENAIKNMDPSFAGKPVYVDHVDSVDLENLEKTADGYVVESFFNKADGKHWAKFIIVSDRGHEAIRSGWKLSNAYILKGFASGGLWHGVEYQKEVTTGEYEHLAIVPNPRYDESVILTPEQFKAYNEKKEAELYKLANSKKTEGENKMGFNFFKKTKVENSESLHEMSVILPKSKREVSVEKLINEADVAALEVGKPVMANGDHKVKVGEEEMTVNELVEKHMAACNELQEFHRRKDDVKPVENEDEEKKENEEDDKKKENGDDEDALKKAKEIADHEKKEIDEKKKNNIEKLKNAPSKASNMDRVIETSEDRVARGKARYGKN